MMNKAVITLVAAAIMLTACNRNQADISSDAQNQPSLQTEVVQESKQPAKESTFHEEMSSLPEYDTIVQYIDKKEYTFRTVTDNESKRVLLLIDQDGKEQYKTIFIKNTSRLKIIQIDGEGQVFNDILDSK
ncbi:hypothetical protein [Cohnella sp. WQ 127256]|uniref:hypothetical protein n=1 Tax=Cohnella sp. WQ 127256 TaxID=2938790 RepID=UPI002118D6F9|nr:hypothetical protein [Cohnella sp. WQ 127256]